MKSTVQIANEILTHLVVRSSSSWAAALHDLMLSEEATKYTAALARKYNTENARTYTKGFADLHAQLPNISKEDFKEATSLLKERGKIVQYGKGKGVAIIILDSTTIPEEEGWIRPDDFSALLKAAASYVPEMERMQIEVTRLRSDLEEANETIAALQEQVKLNYLTTWS